jgi:GNAT superfamily N-acetyltransferase
MPMIIGTMSPHDISFAVDLATSFGWATCAGWFRALLAHGPDGCFVARIGERPVAMVTTTRYARSAWVGNLIVSPEKGKLGLGTALLEHALDHLDALGVATVHLDADPPGRRIYDRHGFLPRFLSRRFRLTGPTRDASTTAVALPRGDLASIANLDRDAFGDDRLRLVRLLRVEADEAFAVWRARRVAGYALVTVTNTGVHVGPWVAEDRDVAMDLLAAADGFRGERTLSVGVAGPNRDAVALLESRGFEERPASLRMTRGALADVGNCQRVFGIGNGAIG